MKLKLSPRKKSFAASWLKTALLAAAVAAIAGVSQAAPTLPVIPSGTFTITSYGASTGSSNNATAIQNAINAASAAGGGTVVVPSGTFLSGPLTLKSKVCLNLASGSTLKMLAYGTYPGNTVFINFGGLNNVKISGSGTIDGQGAAWWTAYTASGNTLARPGMLSGNNCTEVQITGIKLLNAPNVHLSFHYTCNNITVDHMTILSPGTNAPNTDGIDLEGTNYLIDTCNISCGDDMIAIVGSHIRSQYILVQNCTFGTGHGCSIGSYTSNGVDHLTVNNCTFKNGGGIRIKTSNDRGGTVQYLTYSNLTMTGVATPIWISEWYASDPANPTTAATSAVTATTPIYKHILIQNVTATGASSGHNIYGRPESHVSDVVLDNVKITATTGMNIFYADGIVFKNGSKVTVSSGAAVTTYKATVTGVTTTAY